MLNNSGSVLQVPTILRISFLILVVFSIISSLTLCQGIDFEKPIQPITEYEKVIPKTDISLTDSVFVSNDAATMDVKLIDGNLKLSDTVAHTTRDIVLLESTFIKELKGYNGHSVMVYHINDDGVYDSIEIHKLIKKDGFVYLYDIKFSEIIIKGYTGSYTKTETVIQNNVTDTNLGQDFDTLNVTAITINITPATTETSKYDYTLSLNPVLFHTFDNTYIDLSGNGYNAVESGNSVEYSEDYSKYNQSVNFSGTSGKLTYGNRNVSQNGSISLWFYVDTWETDYGTLFGHSNVVGNVNSPNEAWAFLHYASNYIGFYIGNDTDEEKLSYHMNEKELTNIFVMYGEGNFSFYKNNILLGTKSYDFSISEGNLSFVTNDGSDIYNFPFYLDNVVYFERQLNESVRCDLYYDHLQQLQVRTNSNSTWSTEWNSTADNLLSVPFGAGETLSNIQFKVPTTAVIGGETIYDYNTTAQFIPEVTVYHGGNVTKVSETSNNATGYYTLNVTYTPANSGTGYINYTTTDTILLNADFWNAATLTTDNANATLTGSTLPNFSITTGDVITGVTSYYEITVPYFYPPTNIQTTPSQCCVNITWDAVPNADKYSVYELEDGFPYVDTNPTVDGVKDAIYDYAHEFLIFSPNPVDLGDYETIYPLRTSLGVDFLIECVDNDDKLGDDDIIYYFDLDNDGLTINDPAWKLTNNIVKKHLWDGSAWKVTGVSNAVGASTGGGTHYPIHELFIPIAELGANWTNGSTVKVLVKREDSSLSPDVITWYPYGNINNTDTSLWQEMALNDIDSYTLLGNTTNLWYNATGLTPFSIYHGAVSAWNGTTESNYALFDTITEDLPTYTVSGTVLDTDANPIASAIVYSCNGFVAEITTTNASGYWVGYNFREDNYTICASKPGYYDNSIDIFVNSNLTNQNITLSAVPVIVSKYQKIGEMFFAIPTILKLVFQKIADVIPIIIVLAFIMLIINVIGAAIYAIRMWR